MGKIKDRVKSWYRSIPLWLAIFLLASAALLLASFASNKLIFAVHQAEIQLQIQYAVPMELEDTREENQGRERYYYIVDGVHLQEVLGPDRFSAGDRRLYGFYQFLLRYASLFIYTLTLLGAALLFYHTKLKKPLALLLGASKKIAEGDFDFSLEYSGHDEMARLCGAFETMRSALDENNLRLHRMIRERKQLNDAYTHDLRTPLAVLKGYAGILRRFLPTGQFSREKVAATVDTMSTHIDRLVQFVDSMNTAQRLADLSVRRQPVETGDFVGAMRETAAFLCEKRGLACTLEPRIGAQTLNIDPSAVTQVYENLLSNAVRFARERILVELEAGEKVFSLRITDDGRGFSPKELSGADRPYFSGEQTEGPYHFGLGLYICHTLCEKHGGSLTLANAPGGGACVTAVFSL